MKVIIINGIGGVGKSTFISKCKSYCEIKYADTLVRELSTVDYVKKIATICGWDGGKTNSDRVFLSDLKKALAKWKNVPINSVFESMQNISEEYSKCECVFFINSREPEDIACIKALATEKGYDVITLKVVNPNSEVNEVAELIDGISQVDYDVVINNDKDLTHLTGLAINFVNNLFS